MTGSRSARVMPPEEFGEAGETGSGLRAPVSATAGRGQLAERALQALTEGLCVMDAACCILLWNDAAVRLTGVEAEDAVGSSLDALLEPVEAGGAALPPAYVATLEDGQPRQHELFLRHREGHRIHVRARSARMPVGEDGDPGTMGVVVTFDDARPRAAGVRAMLEAQRLTFEDDLTGLGNRRYLERALERALVNAGRGGQPAGLILLDLDGFRALSRRHGRQASERALRVVARTLEASLHPGELAGRWSSDEFLVILPEQTVRSLASTADRLRALVKRSGIRVDGDRHIALTASLGAALSRPGDDVGGWLQRADGQLSVARQSGCDSISVDGLEARHQPRFTALVPTRMGVAGGADMLSAIDDE